MSETVSTPVPSPLRFDFDKAAADARADFPEQTKNVTFINLDAPDVEAQMQKFYDSLPEAAKKDVDRRRAQDWDFLTKNDMPKVWFATPQHGVLLAYGTRTHLCDVEQVASAGLTAAQHLKYTFDHELGHLVVKNADRLSNRAEHGADTFAVLRGMQSAFLTRQEVKSIADGRDMLAWLNADVTHITSLSLDALLINRKQLDFMSLTPKETAAVAAKHAEAFALENDGSAFLRLMRALPKWDFTDTLRADRLENLGKLVLKEEKSSLAFYYAARVLLTARAKQESGAEVPEKIDFTTEKWKKVFDAISEKTGGRDIGANKAVEKNPGTPDAPRQQNLWQKLQMKLTPLKV